MKSDANAIATFNDFPSLTEALRAAREHRNISLETMDKIAGSSDAYFSKVLAPNGSRKLSLFSFGLAMQALGVMAVLVDDPEMLKVVKSRFKPRDIRLVRHRQRRANGTG